MNLSTEVSSPRPLQTLTFPPQVSSFSKTRGKCLPRPCGRKNLGEDSQTSPEPLLVSTESATQLCPRGKCGSLWIHPTDLSGELTLAFGDTGLCPACWEITLTNRLWTQFPPAPSSPFLGKSYELDHLPLGTLWTLDQLSNLNCGHIICVPSPQTGAKCTFVHFFCTLAALSGFTFTLGRRWQDRLLL